MPNIKKTLKIHTADATDPEQLYLKLTTDESGDIYITAVDHKGERIKNGTILEISNLLSCIIIHDELNDDIPLKSNFRDEPEVITLNQIELFREERMKKQFGKMLCDKLIESKEEHESQSVKH